MKKGIIIFSILMCLGCWVRAFQIWEGLKIIERNNRSIKEKIMKCESEIKRLKPLSFSPVGLMVDSYVTLDQQLRLMSRYHDFKLSLDIKNLNKEGVVSDAMSQTVWPGISQMELNVNFYDLKGRDQHLIVFKFLENLEWVNPLRISKIVQTDHYLQAEIKLYGRKL